MTIKTFISDLISTDISGVYKITNPTNGKIYIGSAVCIRARWHRHHSVALKNDDHLPFINALRKYGPKNFEWEVIEEVDISGIKREDAKEVLLEAEQRWLDSEQPFHWLGRGYNHNPTAYSRLGSKQTGKAAAGVPRPNRTGVKQAPNSGRGAKGVRNFKTKLARFIDPDGKIFTRPLTWFCESRGLNKGAMAAIARGKYKSGRGYSNFYKGWTVKYMK